MEKLLVQNTDIVTEEVIRRLTQEQIEQFTIVHCRIFSIYPTKMRIWPSTFLVEEEGNRRKLLHNFNISLYPGWTDYFVKNDYIRFTLVFEGLSKGCRQFHLLEEIPEPFGFYSGKILRNNSDVYQAELRVDY